MGEQTVSFALDVNTLQAAMCKSFTEACSGALQSWNVRKQIEESAQTVLLQTSIDEAVTAALAQVDMNVITSAIAAEFSRIVVSLASNVLTESVVDVLARIRKGSGYMTSEDEKKLRAEIRAKIERKRQ